MSFDYFPPSYNKKLDAMAQDSIDRENKRSQERQTDIKNQPGKTPEAASIVMGGGIVGAVVGFFVCANDVSSGFSNDDWGPIASLGLWILYAIIGLIAGGIIYGFVKAKHNSNTSDASVWAQNEISASKNRIEDIIKKKEQDARTYYQQFEAAAQQMSVQFAESQLALEVIEWMTNGFIKSINAADRRTHIQSINIPFVFYVYKNKITCNLGTYDFELKRCRNLNGPLEQTALARAIASAIQLNITMKYPQDSSGTNIVINTTYAYNDDHVSASVIYTAPNGNYRTVRDWN